MTATKLPAQSTSMHPANTAKMSNSNIPMNMMAHVHNIPHGSMSNTSMASNLISQGAVMSNDNDPNVNISTNSSSGMASAMKQHQPIEIHTEILNQMENVGPDDFDDSDGDDGAGRDKRSGRRKIRIEYIEDKSRRHITFSKRKAGIMKKAYELSTLTGTQVLLLVASETGHVYTFATPKLQPLITKPEGKNLIQACLNAPDQLTDLSIGLGDAHGYSHHRDQLSFPPEMSQMGIASSQSDGGQYHRGSEELKAASAYAASMSPYATAQYMAAASTGNASGAQYPGSQNVAAYLNQVPPQYHHPGGGIPYATGGPHHTIPNPGYMHPGYWAPTSSPGPQVMGNSNQPSGRSSLTNSGINASNNSLNMMGSGSTGNLQHLASGTST